MSFPVRGLLWAEDLSTTEPWQIGHGTSEFPPSSTPEQLFLRRTYRLRPPRLPGLQGHERGVVRQGHEEVVGVHLCAVLLADQGQGHRRQGEQQSVADLQHTLFRVNTRTRPLCGGQHGHSPANKLFVELGGSYLLFQLLQRPSRDALPGLSAVTAHSERTLWRRPHAFGYRSVKKRQVVSYTGTE